MVWNDGHLIDTLQHQQVSFQDYLWIEHVEESTEKTENTILSKSQQEQSRKLL